MPCYDCDTCDQIECCECGDRFDECTCPSNRGVISSLIPKKPRTRAPHVGVEIEFLAPILRNDIAQRLEDQGLGGYCFIKGDGSVSDRDHNLAGHEMNVLCTERNYKQVLRRVTRFLRSIDATVNRTCGLHIHLDMRYRNKERVFSNLVGVQNVLVQMQPRSRRSNSYCEVLDTRNFTEAQRYGRTAINASAYGRHRTIEIRLHSGTTNYKKITSWIAILLKVVGKRSSIETVTEAPDMFRVLRLSPALRTYVNSRIAAFNPPEEAESSTAA